MLTATDLFCGAGGTSTGMEQVPGVTVVMAANHWQLAVDTHNRNLPHAAHDVADLSQVDPRRYPSTDILCGSPECTNHSQARGQRRADKMPDQYGDVLPDEAAERSRATMWDIVRFAEHHNYRAVLVENVVEAAKWRPFQAWLAAMHSLGYHHRIIWLNSMHAHAAGLPAPQSRDRMYVVFWRRGERVPNFDKWTRPHAWCPNCDQVVRALQVFKRPDRPAWGRYGRRAQYVYRCPYSNCRTIVDPAVLPALVALDLSNRGERIGDRQRDLVAKTRARIAAGLRKFAVPVMVPAGGTWNDTAYPVTEVMRTRTTRESEGVAWPPMLVPVEGRAGKHAASAYDPMRTQTARAENGLLFPPFLLRPYTPRDGVIACSGVDDPVPTLTASSRPSLVTPSNVLPFVVPLRNNNTVKGVDEPFDTFAAAGLHHGLVTGVVMRNNGSRGDGAEHCTGLLETLRTLTTAGHQSLVTWNPQFLIEYYGNGGARSVDEPMSTLTTHERHALINAAAAVDDCYFRMLTPDEMKRGMAFPDSFELLGTKREQARLAGNAVTPNVARDLGHAIAEALLGDLAA